MKNCRTRFVKTNWIKSVQNLWIWSHFDAIKIDLFRKIFRTSENFSKFVFFLEKLGPIKLHTGNFVLKNEIKRDGMEAQKTLHEDHTPNTYESHQTYIDLGTFS